MEVLAMVGTLIKVRKVCHRRFPEGGWMAPWSPRILCQLPHALGGHGLDVDCQQTQERLPIALRSTTTTTEHLNRYETRAEVWAWCPLALHALPPLQRVSGMQDTSCFMVYICYKTRAEVWAWCLLALHALPHMIHVCLLQPFCSNLLSSSCKL